MRFLVVDDNPDDRQLEIREIRALFPDVEIDEAVDAASFEACLAKGPHDLVLTDLDLRWGSGREVLMTVKQRCPDCAVIMFTGTGDEATAVELMKSGLDDYIVKSPQQMARLRASLKIAIDLSGSRAALTDRERHLTKALAQQQTLVAELHHRVRNNLQTVTTLLHLHGRNADAETKLHLQDVAGRVEALSAVQARIFDTVQYNRVDFRGPLEDIATTLVSVHGGGRVALAPHFECELVLDVAHAMPLSLLCYEIILNAMKHAWSDQASGTLTVEIIRLARGAEVRISDDGAGFDRAGAAGGTGSRLFRALAEEAGVVIGIDSSPGGGTQVSMKPRA
jgi:two-component sensor histidine kinase